VESPEVWFEDFGSAQLVGGVAQVRLDPKFSLTVSAKAGYKVFLTPNGDCRGLYVAQKSTGGFQVRELSGGSSTVSFDYRIVAHRKGYENVRMREFRASETLIAQMRARAAKPPLGVLPSLARAEMKVELQARREAHRAERPASPEERRAQRRENRSNR
jgi:hypothetical protein